MNGTHDKLIEEDPQKKMDLLHDRILALRSSDHLLTEQLAQHLLEMAVTNADELHQANALRFLGMASDGKADYSKAILHYEEAKRLFQKSDRKAEVVVVNNQLGKIFANIGDYSRAIDYFEDSLRLSRELKDDLSEANTLNAFSVIYQRSGNAEKAAEMAQRSMEQAKRSGHKRIEAISGLNLGNAYGLKNFWSLAVKTWEDSLAIFRQLNEAPLIGSALGNIGIAYLRMGKFEQAEDFIRQCLAIKKEQHDVYDIARSYHNLGTVLWKKGNIDEARELFAQALSMGESARAKSIHVEIYGDLSELLKESGDYKHALETFEQYHKLSGELFSEDMNLKMNSLQIRFEVEKMEKENEIYRLKNIDLAEANKQITLQKEEIEKKNDDITASIRYAQRIQEALLPQESALKNGFSDAFVIYEPRDMVSGDFYWSLHSDKTVFFAVADCTGHGVPGALMSVMGASFLSEIMNERGVADPAEALNLLRLKVITALHGKERENENSSDEKLRDGMDIVLCRYEPSVKKLSFACANNPLWILRDGKIIEFEADKFPVGRHHGQMNYFHSQAFEVKEGDQLFLFTDGFADQFGGPKGKKFGYKQLRDLLVAVHDLPIAAQKRKIEEKMKEWRGNAEQVDDILLLGFRI
jgi:serine phosphatase RsbU (regulator of sigma subunit)/Flp pilus assembly protein TadD